MGDKTRKGSVATALIILSLFLTGCATDYAAYDTYHYRSGPYYHADDYWGHYYYDPYWYGHRYYPWYGRYRYYPPYYRHPGGGGRFKDKGRKFVPPRADGGPGKAVIRDQPRNKGVPRNRDSIQTQRPGGGPGKRSYGRGGARSGGGSKGFNRQLN